MTDKVQEDEWVRYSSLSIALQSIAMLVTEEAHLQKESAV